MGALPDHCWLVELNDNNIVITEKGRELLRYADAVGLSDDVRPN